MLSGGRLFDDGMYGCIFTPPLKCKNKQKQLSSDIKLPLSKIILKDAAELEYSISNVIRKIPLWRNYFVVSESICEPAPLDKQTDKELKDCKPLSEEKLSKFRILSMPYGGTPLNTYRFEVPNLDFMEFAIHFIESGAILNLFGIVHRDIHQGNILVDSDVFTGIKLYYDSFQFSLATSGLAFNTSLILATVLGPGSPSTVSPLSV